VTPQALLLLFIGLSVLREAAETALASLNRRYYLDPRHQEEAVRGLEMSREDLDRSLAYAEDRYAFARVSDWTRLLFGLGFLVAGGLEMVESLSGRGASALGLGPVVHGLLFFGILGVGGSVLSLPFDYYAVFRVEARHGFNRQTRRGFFLDWLKGLLLGGALGGALMAVVLALLEMGGDRWWLYAWAAVSGFSVLTLFLYPRLLAPLFNRFTPLPHGDLQQRIRDLADRVGFRVGGVFVMDASRRTAHGNAYFTGVFREKRIVLFDTLLQALSEAQVVAVLAHELGHFKLNHVRWGLLRAVVFTGVVFYLMAQCVGLVPFYFAFGLSGPSSYGALLVFGAWFGLADFLLQPLANKLSRTHEFAADRFATEYSGAEHLASALRKLREHSHSLPLCHPLFSWVYYSHPPLLERLRAMGKN
jgi:STE24 endopeptidase